jgi:4'-phosphopantetheinyl transferase
MSVDDFPVTDNSTAASLAPTAIASPVESVALWFVALAAGDEEYARISAWLSPAERARAARFGREHLRRRYVIGRASLRKALSDTLSLLPGAVPIVRGARGRPRLDGIAGVDFNISHTDEVALIGVARGARIGVDIERADREVNADGLARKFLTTAEQATLAPLGADGRRERFLRYWTCKEAMSKATGDALSAPFRRLNIRLGDAIELLEGPDAYQPPYWRLYRAAVPKGYFGTVALWSGQPTETSRSSLG